MPSPAIHRRLFIVGCAGAGATTVRDLLASRPGFHCFPRTHLFLRTFGMRGRRLPWVRLGITLGKERRILERVVERASAGGEASPALPPRSLLLRRSLDGLLATLDRLALAAGSRNWVDTTPRHLVHARLIERIVPRSRVIHVVRDGRDVVADQCCRADPREPRTMVSDWNRALARHEQCLGRPGHLFVFHEHLRADPANETVRLMQQCGIPYHIEELERVVEGLRGSELPYPDRNIHRNQSRSRFCERFSASHRKRIERSLDIDRYGEVAEQFLVGRSESSLPHHRTCHDRSRTPRYRSSDRINSR